MTYFSCTLSNYVRDVKLFQIKNGIFIAVVSFYYITDKRLFYVSLKILGFLRSFPLSDHIFENNYKLSWLI